MRASPSLEAPTDARKFSTVTQIETISALRPYIFEQFISFLDPVLDALLSSAHTPLTPFKSILCEPMRMLVAENDVPLADFLCQKLEAEQFSVELIPGTSEAENLVAERLCDLALLDLALPYAAGIDALRHIRARKPELPVVFLTSLESVDANVPGAWTEVRTIWCPNHLLSRNWPREFEPFCAAAITRRVHSCKSKTL